MANKVLGVAGALLLLAACGRELPSPDFDYPPSKVWAHGVNDTLVAQQKSLLFDGLELDVNYSAFQQRLFMGHELYDTIHGLTLEQWFAALPDASRNFYWVDMKNLTPASAPVIAHQLKQLVHRYGIEDKLMVEHTDEVALKVLKDSSLHVILWVENTYWTHRCDRNWRRSTRRQIAFLHPDALSCEYRMYPLLPRSFPNQNIHFWDTPREYNDTNVTHTRMLLRDTSVRVVLVDYPVDVSREVLASVP